MVRSVTFEIRWHETQPIYGCSFQAVPPAQLRRILDHNAAQAAGLAPGKLLAGAASAQEAESSAAGASKAGPSSSKAPAAAPIPAAGQSWKFATGGGDNYARIWQLHPNIPSPAALAAAAGPSGSAVAPHPPRVEYMATLKRHTGVVNCVSFCPKGELLATGSDDGTVILWVPDTSGFTSSLDDDGDSEFAKEHWRTRSLLKVSTSEIYDMAWAASGDMLIAGGTDFVARIINTNDGTILREIAEHSHYVQGVSWDPLNEFVATQSSDRTVHLHALQHKSNDSHAISGSHSASRNSRMDVHHRRSASNSGSFVWDPSAKPPMHRRASGHASASDEREGKELVRALERHRSGRSVTPMLDSAPPAVATSTPSGSATAATPAARDATPAPAPLQANSVPQSPAVSATSMQPMHPPQRTPSRRSSFSSQVEALSPPTSVTSLAPSSAAPPLSTSVSSSGKQQQPVATTSAPATVDAPAGLRRSVSRSRGARTGTPRSPSPAPPLPAIRAPPSPRQRMANVAPSPGQVLRSGMRMYGDENYSGFFRRLSFSPDGALLATPSGIFDAPGHVPAPASPTVGFGSSHNGGIRRGSEASDVDAASHRISPAITTSAAPLSGPSLGPTAPRSTVYLYGRGNFHRNNSPIAHLPGHKTATLVVKFNPILYELREGRSSDFDIGGIAPHPTIPLEAGKQKVVALDSAASKAGGLASSSVVTGGGNSAEDEARRSAAAPPPSMIGLPYRMVFAVATHDSVFVYDTQQGGPLCCFSNIHYSSFTDLEWSPDGQCLLMCSSDGYCSIASFDYEELGKPYNYASQPSLASLYAHSSHSTAPASQTTASGAAPPSSSSSESGSVSTAPPPRASPMAVRSSPASQSKPTFDSIAGLRGAAATASAAGNYSSDSDVAPETSSSGEERGKEASARKKRRIAPTLLS